MSQNDNALNAALLEAVQGTDVQNLLDHIAWTDVIEPKLKALKEQYADLLVNYELGVPLPGKLTREQLAGRIYGLNFITKLLRDILERGAASLDDLKSIGFSLSQ